MLHSRPPDLRFGKVGADTPVETRTTYRTRDVRFCASASIDFIGGFDHRRSASLVATVGSSLENFCSAGTIGGREMVLHLEPKLEMAGGVYQTEEVVRVTESGPEFLSDISRPSDCPVDL
ncbi:hypothetical protein [Bradyrhizobium sp. CCBAU 25360]|uniref:hypothetical protein n=1 Tax=Bradyrhizobium sp. CCBAU 25360 TaxID=858425 RepID=UPI0023051624|nr:hypothetical protein [Bradyrhizobium sp. CCBAU 25360]